MTTDTQQSLDTFIREYKIRAICERTDHNPDLADSQNMDHWRVTLIREEFPKRRMTVYFSMGYGHNGHAPTVADVLSCLASDVTEETFEQWASEMGFDSDSRKAERTFKAVQRQTKKLKRFLVTLEGFENLMYHTERL